MNLLDAVSEGDGKRIMRQYKYLMLLCKADDPHSTKYALESLYQLVLVNGLSQKESEMFVWNRTVNNHGGLGNNIPHDLEVEHSNNFNKQGYCNIGANLSEKAVSRICYAEKPVRTISGKMDKLLQRFIRSGKHIQRFPVVDLDVLLKKLNESEVFKYQKGRSYRHFKGFERDALVNLDMSKIYSWLNDHKKSILWVSRRGNDFVHGFWSIQNKIKHVWRTLSEKSRQGWTRLGIHWASFSCLMEHLLSKSKFLTWKKVTKYKLCYRSKLNSG